MGNPTKPLTEVGAPLPTDIFPLDRFDDSVAGAGRRRAVNDIGDQAAFEIVYARWDNATGYYSTVLRARVIELTGTGEPVQTPRGWWYVFTCGQKDQNGRFISLCSTSQYFPYPEMFKANAHLNLEAFDAPTMAYGPDWPTDT